ncbi:hypothetical protein TSUD_159780 [Trifolium subterraneum]|uniref:Uncharacterized protein n=1 Tax=Trifolium subterraneum TaxID=3900 RepID=A0A2Z6M656_TRISU|nr:hypothetical protein TSUD_159780 [Trifolium subterraneum]
MHRFSYWSIGNGREIDAWCEAWLYEGVRINDLLNVRSHMIGMKVSELVDDEGNWNQELLKNWMPDNLIKKIAAILPPKDDYDIDEMIIAGGNKVEYFVANMYNNLCGFDHEEASANWSKIWKLQVLEKIVPCNGDLDSCSSSKSQRRVFHEYTGELDVGLYHVIRFGIGETRKNAMTVS